MFLIVGLGNPGKRYEKTRHNLGFMVIDKLAQDMDLDLRAGEGEYLIATSSYKSKQVILAKPLTFMNLSGQAVADLVYKLSLPLSNLLIIIDDVNLPLGTLRLRKRGSDGGHKGLRSVIYHLNTEDFPRLRLGIGSQFLRGQIVEYVLSEFEPDEMEIVKEMVNRAKDAVLSFIDRGIDATMSEFNLRIQRRC